MLTNKLKRWVSRQPCRWKGRLDSAYLDSQGVPPSRVLFSAAEVSAAYDRMADRISVEFQDSAPTIVAVLKGGMVTAVELLKRIELPCELDYVHVARYGDAMQGGELKWIREPVPSLAGREILLVDDILDEGVTLSALVSRLKTIGAVSVHTAVLLSKAIPGRDFVADFTGLNMTGGYVFGCGMDYQGRWRGLNEVRVIE